MRAYCFATATSAALLAVLAQKLCVLGFLRVCRYRLTYYTPHHFTLLSKGRQEKERPFSKKWKHLIKKTGAANAAPVWVIMELIF
jgi:hypothetical protein